MNELAVFFNGGNYVYYKIEEMAVDKAFDRFLESCESIGLNLDNVHFCAAHLRDANGRAIDVLHFENGKPVVGEHIVTLHKPKFTGTPEEIKKKEDMRRSILENMLQ